MPCLDFFKHLMPRLLPVATRPRYMSPPPTERWHLSATAPPLPSPSYLCSQVYYKTYKQNPQRPQIWIPPGLWRLTAFESSSTPAVPSYLSSSLFPGLGILCMKRTTAGWLDVQMQICE